MAYLQLKIILSTAEFWNCWREIFKRASRPRGALEETLNFMPIIMLRILVRDNRSLLSYIW